MQVVSALALMERIKQFAATLGSIDPIALINTVLIIKKKDMANKHYDYIRIDIFLDLIDDLGIKKKDAREMLEVSSVQFRRWELKGLMPTKHYWAFQKELTIFLQKQMIKKMVRIGLIDKEFLKELLECV